MVCFCYEKSDLFNQMEADMNFVKYLVVAPLIAVMLSILPAHAGKDKTDTAWTSEVTKVKESVKDKVALSKISEMVDIMNDGWQNMYREDFYELASKMFGKLTVLSAKHGGPKITTPDWIDAPH